MQRSLRVLRLLILPMVFLSNAASARGGEAHEGDFIVGRTSANQLAAEFNPAEPFVLPSLVFIPGDGWGLDDPGFNALPDDEPEEDFFMLSGSAQVAVELVSKHPDLAVLDDILFTPLMENPGDQWVLPVGAGFDVHPFWFIDDPDFSEVGSLFDFSFKLVDLGGTHLDSVVYSAQFTPVPEAMSGVMLACGALAVMRPSHRSRMVRQP